MKFADLLLQSWFGLCYRIVGMTAMDQKLLRIFQYKKYGSKKERNTGHIAFGSTPL